MNRKRSAGSRRDFLKQGAARSVVWSARPDEKIFTWDMKIKL
jgi:hypothetical protein